MRLLRNLPVCFKVFKAKDIENTNGGSGATLGFVNGGVDLAHDPDEEPPIDTLDEGISDVCGLAVTQMGYLRTKTLL